MNYFFALDVPDAIKKEVAKASAEWAALLQPPLRAKWSEPEDYHITLQFLGDLPQSTENDLVEIAEPVAAKGVPFDVQFFSFDAFDSLMHPRVLYVSVEKNATRVELTNQLRQRITEHGDLIKHGYQPDTRPPRPHLTVARHCKGKEGISWPGWPTPDERVFPSWEASHFVLMQTLPPESRAKASKARYNIVHTFPFGGQPIGQGEIIG